MCTCFCNVLGLVLWKGDEREGEKKDKPWRNVSFPHTLAGTGDTDVLRFLDNRAALSVFVYVCVRGTQFPMCWTLPWSGGWTDKLPLLTLNLCLGPCCIKGPMSEALLLCAALTFLQGLIQSDWTEEEVEGGSSFNRQTLVDNVQRLSSQSVPWLTLWVQQTRRDFLRKKGCL